MSNARRFAALAIAAAGLSVAAATPARACMDWGYSGIYSHGWPYANTGFASYPAYAHRDCGGHYEIQGWGECNGFGPCAFAPLPPVAVTVPVAGRRADPLEDGRIRHRPRSRRAAAVARE